MASNTTIELIKLNGNNYSLWKLQLRMALIMDNFWDIVNGMDKQTEYGTTEDKE